MARRNLTGSTLMSSSLLDEDGRDPMESMGNLMDVMLVFACGLLLALVANWNIDLTSGSSPAPSATQLEGELSDAGTEIDTSDSNYSEVGVVYRDEETGELYVVQ